MENKTGDQSFSNNGHSLQLHSREVSEVMGNIPGWIGSWGPFLICLFFAISILFIVNINSVQKIQGKATIGLLGPGRNAPGKEKYFLQIVMPTAGSDDIRKSRRVVLFVTGKNNYLNSLNGFSFSVNDVKTKADSCVLQVSLCDDIIRKIKLPAEEITNPVVECRLETNISVYKKMFRQLF